MTSALSVRLGLYYAAIFGVIGIHLPFFPLWLKAQGFDAGQIGVILSAMFLLKIVTNPAVGGMVDRRGDRRRPLIFFSAASFVAFALYVFWRDFWAVLAVTLLATAVFAPVVPVSDNLTLLAIRSRGLDYGRIRLWGSIAFIVTSMLGGRLVGLYPPDVVLVMILAGLGVLALFAVALPDVRTEAAGRRGPPAWELLRSKPFLLFVGATSLNQMSHSIYYGFATIHWQTAGLPSALIGGLWAEGVVAEVLLFAWSGKVVARVGPARLILLACAAGVLRWAVMGMGTSLPALAAVQILHAMTFGCAHLGAMHFMQRAAPPGLSVRAQTLYTSLTMGVAPGLSMLVSGRLYEAAGGLSFAVMAALSLIGALLAQALVARWDGGVLPISR